MLRTHLARQTEFTHAVLSKLTRAALSATMLWASGFGPLTAAQAQDSGQHLVLLPGPVLLEPRMEQAVAEALKAVAQFNPEAQYFAITDLRSESAYYLASVVAFSAIGADMAWNAEEGIWFGLVALKPAGDGQFSAAAQGTREFSAVLTGSSSALLEAETSEKQSGVQSATTATSGPYIFPWPAGTAMVYGPLGIHDGDAGGKAVDWASDGNTGAGHSTGLVIAAEAGIIDYVCKDGTSVAIRVGHFYYYHLLDNSGLYAGRVVAQGEQLGQLRAGSFNANCGYASQPSNWFHLHWVFPNADLQVEDWTLSMSTGLWTNGTLTAAPGSGWITAHGLPAPEPDHRAADLGYFRPSAGTWGFLLASTGYSYDSALFVAWGQADDLAVPGDYDGDGLTDPTIRRAPANGQSAAYLSLLSSSGYDFGAPLMLPAGWPGLGDRPVPADYNGDGIMEPATFRGNTGTWVIPLSPGFTQEQFASWGMAGDIPVGADVDGDLKADIGYFRPSTGVWGFLVSGWNFSYSNPVYFSWGSSTDTPVMKDYDGDGKADPAVVTPPAGGQSAAYRILLSTTGYDYGRTWTIPAGWPGLGDTPVPNDYDGDGKADAGIWRSSTGVWIIPKSSTNNASYLYVAWGASGDQVVR